MHPASQSSNPNKMETEAVPKLVISMAVPFMLSLLIQNLYNVVDSIFVSRISETALAATSLAYPVQVLAIAICVGLGVGANALISRLLGEHRSDDVRAAATTALLLAGGFSLLFTLTALFFIDPLVSVLTKDPATVPMCREYLSICMLFCFGQFIEIVSLRFMQASGKMILSMFSMMIGAAVNLILDPILIFGMFSLPAMGVRGAATATVIGQWCGAVAALLINHRFNPEVRPSFRPFRWSPSSAREILRIGIPTMIMHGMNSVMNFGVNRLLLPFSSSAVAFYGVYYKLQNFLTMPLSGLGQAVIPIIGYNFGARNAGRIRQAIKNGVLFSVAVAAASTLLFQSFPAQLLSLFNAGPEMLSIGVPAIRIISATYLFSAVTTILGFSVSGLGNGVVNMVGTSLRQVILLLPAAWVLIRFRGLSSVWYAFWLSETAACLITVLYSRYVVRKRLRSISPV